MSTTIENLHSNKRKFLSDLKEFFPSTTTCFRSNQIQVDSNTNTKKLKTEENNETDNMMICEDTNTKETKTPTVLIPKHCNGICNADASPTTLIIRCYCDPYRLGGLVPYHSDIY